MLWPAGELYGAQRYRVDDVFMRVWCELRWVESGKRGEREGKGEEERDRDDDTFSVLWQVSLSVSFRIRELLSRRTKLILLLSSDPPGRGYAGGDTRLVTRRGRSDDSANVFYCLRMQGTNCVIDVNTTGGRTRNAITAEGGRRSIIDQQLQSKRFYLAIPCPD